MNLRFKKIRTPNLFFKILPSDWQDIIIPQWSNYQESSTIYVIEHHKAVIAGGIVFSKTPPNATLLELDHSHLFDKGYLYLGFIFVLPEYRNKSIASKWLQALKDQHSDQKFWLTIEDFGLKFFYEKNGFKFMDQTINAGVDEWVLISE